MMNSKQVRLSRLTLGLMVALAAAPAFAQTTSAALGGRVVGVDGQPVAGAVVTIVHEDSGTTSRATTDADGRYVARGLRVGGPFTVNVQSAVGTSSQEGVYLRLGETTSLASTVGEAVDLDAVTVTASSTPTVFSPDAMGASTQIDREQIEGFASIQRSLQDYARLDPRVSQTDKERGEISVAGQNSRFNSITIDGVNISDSFGLEANNLPTNRQPISIDAIEQVQVNISNVDVAQRGYTGANINAVTKSGTNEFSGSAYYVWRDDNLSGQRYNATSDSYFDPSPSEDQTTGFTLGGPLVRDRLFFFVNYEDSSSTRIGNDFVPLGSNGNQVFITPADITAAQNLARTLYGIEIGGVEAPSTAEQTTEEMLVKLDWTISDAHRASLRYNKTEELNPVFPGFGTRNLSTSSHWYDQGKTVEAVVGQLFSDWSDTFSTELRVQRREYDSVPDNASFLPQVDIRFTGGTPPAGVLGGTRVLRFGTERSRHLNVLRTVTDEIFAAGNLYLGDHELKVGFDYATNDVYNAFLQDTRGNYTFGCLLASQCTTSFEAGRPISYQVQVPRPGQTLDNGIAQWDLGNIGVFVQDTWAVNYNLTIVAGLRYDRTQMPDSPLRNAAAVAAFGLDNSQTLDGKGLLQPRLGVNYTFDTERSTQLRGGIGLFEGSAANVWLSNPYSNTGIATAVIGCGISGFAACPTTGTGIFSPNPNTQPTSFAGAIPASNVDFLSSDLRQPAVWKANIAFDHETPFFGAIFSAELLFTEVEHGVYYRHLNLGNATDIGVDGRELFWNASGFNPNCWAANGNTVSTGGCAVQAKAGRNVNFNNVLLAERTGRGGGENLTLSLSRPRGEDGWNWSVAYNYSQATEVSPLTSSVANSNFNGRSTFNPNEEVEGVSPYVVRDRFVATLGWSHDFFGDYATEFGLLYEGRSGKPYSWTFANDMNGDGVSGNDLLYIPVFGADQVVFRGGAAEEARFWEIVNAEGLSGYQGQAVGRNSERAGWTNNFDLRVRQELPGFMEGHNAEVVLDILNVGNLINKEWGRIEEIGFQAGGGQARSFVNYVGLDAQGRYVYSLSDVEQPFVRQNRGESQWAAQLTLRYRF